MRLPGPARPSRGKYRVRTWLRGNLPEALSRFFPKGESDCGNHEWYNHDNLTDHCYHCTVGGEHTLPSRVRCQLVLRGCTPYGWRFTVAATSLATSFQLTAPIASMIASQSQLIHALTILPSAT